MEFKDFYDFHDSLMDFYDFQNFSDSQIKLYDFIVFHYYRCEFYDSYPMGSVKMHRIRDTVTSFRTGSGWILMQWI